MIFPNSVHRITFYKFHEIELAIITLNRNQRIRSLIWNPRLQIRVISLSVVKHKKCLACLEKQQTTKRLLRLCLSHTRSPHKRSSARPSQHTFLPVDLLFFPPAAFCFSHFYHLRDILKLEAKALVFIKHKCSKCHCSSFYSSSMCASSIAFKDLGYHLIP